MPEGRAVRITRRSVVLGLGALAATGAGTGAYAVGVEPQRLRITGYEIRTRAPWPHGRSLRLVALADIHACEPWMTLAHIGRIVEVANGLGGDAVVLLGDYVAGMHLVTGSIPSADWAPVLGRLRAPLGTYAILGNHDWWDDRAAVRRGHGPTIAGEALTRGGIRVLENQALPLDLGGAQVWLAGLGDQIALAPMRRRHPRIGVDDLAGTLAQVPAGAATVLLAHEPDIFPKVPAHVALTLCGHTHGGQVRLFGRAFVVPSRYGERYAYGHVREQTDLVVSGGLGMSGAPIRFGMPPEIVVVDISGEAAQT